MFTHITKNIVTSDSLICLDNVECEKLRGDFLGIPNEYISFLNIVGFGNLGDIQLYSRPVKPVSIYGEGSIDSLDNLIIFGDDFQGFCFAFDQNESFRVVEISPKGEVDQTVESSFLKLLEGYFG